MVSWNGQFWAPGCYFQGNDLTNAQTSSKDCSSKCTATPGCTHYTWTTYNGGTCYMKQGAVSKKDAI
jgi:PAN domain